ncbi:hypothetical protein EFK68_04010 [Pseudomonas aeruginosa]|nr:hypothetical protein EFK68_04010 [Pseudomonas aeruginosa]
MTCSRKDYHKNNNIIILIMQLWTERDAWPVLPGRVVKAIRVLPEMKAITDQAVMGSEGG